MQYSFESTGARGALHTMVISATVAAAVLFFMSTLDDVPFPIFFQTGAVVCLALAAYLCTRYSLRLYRYAIEPNGIMDVHGVEQNDLVITEITGKKIKIVAKVALRDIDACIRVIRRDSETTPLVKEAFCKNRQVFRYANTPIIPVACYLSVPGEGAVIVIPWDDRMATILRAQTGNV